MSISLLRAFRSARGLTLDELGKRARIERSKISRAERGFAKLSKDELRRLSRVLRVRVVDLEQGS
jgi:transcriptional regulator with XRE-family HTH domain